VLRRIAGEQPAPINRGFAGQCLSLGRRVGIFQFAPRTDIAMSFHLGGRHGATLKEFVCLSTVKQLVHEARKPGSYTWAKDDQRRQLLQARLDEALATTERAA
ncbi:MAG: FAD-dependent oxidoreductase, partial [Sciscionella sp.]